MRVLMLDLDTLRPDHLGCYGYHRNTSPNIDRIAAGGVRFNNYYCSDAPCLPSRAALVSGQHGIRSGVVGHGGTAADMRLQGAGRSFQTTFSHENLWSIFRYAGMKTASINPFARRHSAWWFNAGFDETLDTGRCGMESAEEVTPTVLDWIDRNAGNDNWFLHVNYWDPHTPYRAPEAFGNPFAGDPLPEWMTEERIREHNTQPGGHSSLEVDMWQGQPSSYPRHLHEVKTMKDFRKMIDGYDCGIRYMDEHIGRLFAALEEKGVMEDLCVIITSDHGENLGELNSYAEHGTSDYITHRIPMIIRMPDGQKGHVDEGLHYNLDLAPTLADLFGQKRAASWQGESYAATIREGKNTGREALILGQCCHGAMRSVRWGDWIYIRVIHDFLHLYPREMLFNVKNDPHETVNLAETRPEVAAEGARYLLTWQEDRMMEMPDAVDPLWTVMREGGPLHSRGALPAYLKRLEETGRGQHVAPLKARHGVV